VVIPLSIGGWGLREGAAAWAFAAAGLGAATGVTVATLYAVLMLAAVTPGAGLLLTDSVHRRRTRDNPASPDGPIRRRRRRRPPVADRPGPATGPGTPLTAPPAWREAERLAR
jgi:hypothetical protein